MTTERQSNNEDLLIEIFDRQVRSGEFDETPPVELFAAVVEDYVNQMSLAGVAPRDYLEQIYEDLLLETENIFKIKTYGFINLKQYRQSLK